MLINSLFVVTGPMQSAGGEGAREDESFSQDEKDTKSQEGPDKTTEDCEATAPSAQEV